MSEVIKLGTSQNWGTKENGVLAYNDTNNIFKAIELQSSRASSATRVNEQGLIENVASGVPRIDYTNGVGELLLEPESTNLITYSEEFDNVAWVGLNGGVGSLPVVTPNSVLSPDGSVNADRIVFDKGAATSNTDFSILRNDYGGADVDGTASVYLRADSNVQLEISGDDIVYETINVTTEWQRFSISDSTVDRVSIGLRGTEPSNNSVTVYAWGAQLEQQSYPTSYIPTDGGTATRIADAVTGNSSLGQVINSSEGVLYAEMSALANDGTFRAVGISDGNNNRVFLYYTSTTNQIGGQVFVGGANQAHLTNSAFDVLTTNKIALKYKSNDFALWINGALVGTEPSGSVFSANTLDKHSLDTASGSSPFYGRIRELKVYDEALTDAELQQLTS